MPSIVVINDDGNVLFQNLMENTEELIKTIKDGRSIPGFNPWPSEVRINGFIIIAQQTPLSRREVPALSMKQMQVLQLMAMSLTPEQTALKLGISESTVRLHIHALKKKFNTESRDQMMAMAGSLGLCDPFGEEKDGKEEGED